ncbi:MAG: TetR/AcrR family transcriptional regulator [Myxococcales bacterium]
MSEPRPYNMKARAESAQATHLSIIAAAVALFMETDWADVSLEMIAARAQVTLQTVLRRFGSKAGLFSAAVEQVAAEVQSLRVPARKGDARAAIRALVDLYEKFGEMNWRLLRHEAHDPALAALLDRARSVHRTWLEEVFDVHLPARGKERERRLSLLFAATDFYVWKLARKDLKRSRAQAERVIFELVEALLQQFELKEEP